MDKRHLLIISENQQDHLCCRETLGRIRSVDYLNDWQPEPEKALVSLEEIQYQCVLISSALATMTTSALLQKIRSSHPWLPIVLITQSSDEMLPAVLIVQGAQEYIDRTHMTGETLHNTISKAIFLVEQKLKRQQRQDSPCSVLIIDDCLDDLEFCVRSLTKRSERYVIKTATNAPDGLQHLKTFFPDCVLLDYSLPSTTGLHVLSQILTLAPGTPVIMLTGQGDENTAVEAMKRGAQNYLVKSNINGDQLHKYVMEVVEKKYLEDEIFHSEQSLSRKHNELSSAYAFQDLVIDSLPDFVYVKNPQLRIVRANKAFMSLFPDEVNVIGSTLQDFFKSDFQSFIAKDQQALDLGYAELTEHFTFPNGRKYILFIQKKRFVDAEGNEFILCVSKDVTEREALISQLETSNQDLEQFVYIASHDLKTPLNGIKRVVGWIEEDHGDELSPALWEHFSLIKSRTERISQLLQDLLDYARVTAKLEDEESIDFREFCLQTLSLLDCQSAVQLSAPSVQVNLPRIALQIVLMNLFSNSIKHADHHAVEIQVAIQQHEKGYQLIITDTGPGIPTAYAEKVFHMFHTLKPRDMVEGSGMGLAMVKKVLEHYNGHITLDTNYQKGCQMQIFWPVKHNAIEVMEKSAP